MCSSPTAPAEAPSVDLRARAVLIGGSLLLLVLRYAFADALPLSPDEAYYWQWSRNMGLAYGDHPPMVAWLIRLGCAVAGDGPAGVRLLAPILGAACGVTVWFIAKEARLPEEVRTACALLAQVLPAPATGCVMMTPDVPLGLAWTTFTLVLMRLVGTGNPRLFYLASLPAALAILSKHTGFLLPPLALFVCAKAPRCRAALRSPHPLLALATTVLVASPWLWAEIRAGLPSISHQAAHLAGRLGGTSVSPVGIPGRLLELAAGQAGLLTPLVALFIARSVQRARLEPTFLPVVRAAFWLPIAATGVTALFTHPEQNWASLGHPLAPVIVATFLADRPPATGRRLLRWTAAIALLMTALIHLHALTPSLPLPPHRDPLTRLRGWEELRNLRPTPDTMDAVVCDNYGLCALLAWHWRHAALPPIVAMDRGSSPVPPGRILLLDEESDFGDAHLRVRCRQFAPMDALSMRTKDGILYRRILGGTGVDCVRAAE